MMIEPTRPNSNESTTPRLWPFVGHWRRSSRFVAGLTLLIAITVMVPGQYVHHVRSIKETFELAPQYEHGWPLTFLIRNVPVAEDRPATRIRYEGSTAVKCWQFWASPAGHELFLGSLLGDLTIAIASVIAAGMSFEAWRRRHKSIWHIHLLDIGILITAAAIGLGFYAAASQRWRAEHSAANFLHDLPGAVYFDSEEGGPTWLRERTDDAPFKLFDRFIAVGSDYVSPCHIPPASLLAFQDLKRASVTVRDSRELEPLESLPQLEWLDIQRLKYMPGNVSSTEPVERLSIPRLHRLKVLTMSGGNYAPENMNRLNNLELLVLNHSVLLDRIAVREIGELPHLKSLQLHAANLVAEDLPQLRELHELRYLHLDHTATDDAALAELMKIPSLNHLSIRDTSVTAQGLLEICKSQTLESLELTTITRSELELLSQIPTLRWISVSVAPPALRRVSEYQGWKLTPTINSTNFARLVPLPTSSPPPS